MPEGAWATLQRSLLWVVLGGWLGAWAFFALVVAPTAFRVLPASELAGSLVAPLLTHLHLYGVAAGVVLGLLALWMGRGWRLALLPLLLTVLCLVSEFGVSAAIADVRPRDFGPDTPGDSAARFAALHRASRALYALVGAGTFLLAVLHARADALRSGSRARKLL